jgi:2'-5' RNA ligase
MTRTFIAIERNEHLQHHLEQVIHQVAQILPSMRWVNPKGIHLTLAFLGELDDAQLADAAQAAQVAAQQVEAFHYRLTRLGIFGASRHPRVLWMGIDETSGTLNNLQRILYQQLEQRGFALDKRAFSPHLTLARGKAPLSPSEQHSVQQLLEGSQQGITSTAIYPVQHIEVMKSELSKVGTNYTLLRSYPLS